MKYSALAPLLAMLVLAGSSCSLFSHRSPYSSDEVDRENAATYIDLARQDTETGEALDAIERLVAVRNSPRLTPEQLRAADALLDTTVRRLLGLDEAGNVVSDPSLDASQLKYLYKLKLPLTLRASAGILSARALFRAGHPVNAYKRIRAVDKKLPEHAARTLGGEVLGEIGLSLIRRSGNYNLIFSYAKRGVVTLEYLVVNYPLATECAEAYVELSRYYERTADYDYAIERLEDLLLYHPNSPFTIAAEAHLPYLRLERLRRNDYDRNQIVLATREIDQWLARHRGHELEPAMEQLRARAEKRLAQSDLILARYYKKVHSPLGVRLHAERSLAEAESSGSENEAREARDLLAELPSDVETGAPAPAPTTIQPIGPAPKAEDSVRPSDSTSAAKSGEESSTGRGR